MLINTDSHFFVIQNSIKFILIFLIPFLIFKSYGRVVFDSIFALILKNDFHNFLFYWMMIFSF